MNSDEPITPIPLLRSKDALKMIYDQSSKEAQLLLLGVLTIINQSCRKARWQGLALGVLITIVVFFVCALLTP